MRQPNVTVYGSHTCPDTNRATRYLDAQGVAYEFKSVDDFPELNDYLAELNGGTRVMPTIQVNNEVFINPAENELGAAIARAAEVARA
jgi:glutaredoxin